jgi:hypothetical protein
MKPKYLALIVIAIAVVVYMLWQSPNKETKKSMINTTGQKQETTAKAKPAAKTTKEKTATSEPTITNWETDIINERDQDRTYMVVYDDLKFSKRCEDYYQAEHADKSAFMADEYFRKRFISPLNPDYQPSDAQLNSFRAFLQACDALKKATFLRANIEKRYPQITRPYPVIKELENELEITPAKSAEAQSLKKTLKLKQQWQELLEALVAESKGPLVMNEDERAQARSQMRALSTEMMAMSQEADEVDVEVIMDLAQEIQDLQAAMTETVGGDEEARQQLLTELIVLEEQLRKLLQSPHLETFLVAMSALEFSESFDLRINAQFAKFQYKNVTQNIPEYISPSQVLREMSGIPDDNYYDALIKPASYLFLCQKGHDCSDTSALITEYCWGSMDKIKLMTGQVHPQACGLDVKSFFHNHFLTENQKIDLQYLIDLMGEIYAP